MWCRKFNSRRTKQISILIIVAVISSTATKVIDNKRNDNLTLSLLKSQVNDNLNYDINFLDYTIHDRYNTKDIARALKYKVLYSQEPIKGFYMFSESTGNYTYFEFTDEADVKDLIERINDANHYAFDICIPIYKDMSKTREELSLIRQSLKDIILCQQALDYLGDYKIAYTLKQDKAHDEFYDKVRREINSVTIENNGVIKKLGEIIDKELPDIE